MAAEVNMRRFFRRRRARFAPFDRTALPEVEPLTFEETYAEGLLVAESAGRMALKNRIIVMALRGEEPYDAERSAAAAREVLHELMQETDEVAEWSAAERESAAQREGRSAHQHDYHRADAWNLRLRERVNAALAKRLGELRNDPEYLAAFAERARRDAWSEIAEVIDARLAREWPEIEVDETYERERDGRVRGLELDLQRELEEIRRRREERDELDDAFGGWVG
jgi:cytochrome c556